MGSASLRLLQFAWVPLTKEPYRHAPVEAPEGPAAFRWPLAFFDLESYRRVRPGTEGPYRIPVVSAVAVSPGSASLRDG